MSKLDADLIVSTLGDVADPGKCLVARFLDDLEVAHLDATDCEVWDLEVNLDGGTFVRDVVVGDGRQTKVCTHEELAATWELLDRPDDSILQG